LQALGRTPEDVEHCIVDAAGRVELFFRTPVAAPAARADEAETPPGPAPAGRDPTTAPVEAWDLS
jgi:hypothetical protein